MAGHRTGKALTPVAADARRSLTLRTRQSRRDFLAFETVSRHLSVIEHALTDLDPASNWNQAWQNQNGDAQSKGYVDLEAALVSAAQMLADIEVY